ncbi:LexA family transcriptional regulator [Croceibacterium mercuriale]|nr:hypothetical protein [Croceibacterium mercuriale]
MTAAHPSPATSGTPTRITSLAPDMASFRLLVLGFVRDYIGLMHASPSYGEIAAELDSSRKRVMKAVRSLERDGLLIRAAGPRGLRLPSLRDAAIRQLRDAGFFIDEDLKIAAPVPPESWFERYAAHLLPVTKKGSADGRGARLSA